MGSFLDAKQGGLIGQLKVQFNGAK